MKSNDWAQSGRKIGLHVFVLDNSLFRDPEEVLSMIRLGGMEVSCDQI